jgi:hypothetical protein
MNTREFLVEMFHKPCEKVKFFWYFPLLLLRWINNEIRKSQTEHILLDILKFILL